MGWVNLIAALGVFLATHAIPARPRVRAALVARCGRAGYLLGYSVLSLAVLWWLIRAVQTAPYLVLWDLSEPARWTAAAMMLGACLLLAYAALGTNPLSLGSRAAPFDPARPGIAGVTRHPFLWALILWAVAHVLANGDLASVILFGTLGGFAALAQRIIDTRKRRALGADEWRRLTACARSVPFHALLTGAWRPTAPPPLWPAMVAVAIFVVLLALHPVVIGVAPFTL